RPACGVDQLRTMSVPRLRFGPGRRNMATKAEKIVAGLGGIDNIEEVEGCITRLRTEVVDAGKVDEAALKPAGAHGVAKMATAIVTEGVPRSRKGSGDGWVTAEYCKLPRATNTRGDRESVRGRIGGRTHEISRLIGRSLRAVIDYKALGENTIVLDCDVLQADGGTRTAAITGAYVALADAIGWMQERKIIRPSAKPLIGTVAAVSVGI